MLQNQIFKQSFTSSSAILSAVTGEVRRWMLNQFPEDFFNYIRITSGIPSVDDTQGDADRMKAYRKSNPCLAIRPTMKFQTDLTGEYIKSPMTFHYEDVGPDSHFYTLYRNDQFMQTIKFALEYWKCELQIGVRVETEVQGIDIVGYLKHRIFPGHFFYLNDCPVLVEIPSTVLFRAAADIGMDLFKKEDVKAFIDILQKNSFSPIDIKIKKDSGQKIVAFLMPCNILCKVDDIGEPEVNKNGRSQDDTKIKFILNAQIPFPRQFKLFTEMPVPSPDGKQYSPEMLDKNKANMPFVDDYFSTGQMIINYALTTEPPQYLPGTSAKRIYMSKFVTSQDQELDYLELAGIMPKALECFIDDMMQHGKEDILNEAVIVHLYRDEKLIEDSNYKFDFKTKKLILFHPFRNYIYRVVFYIETTILHRYEAALHGITDLTQIFDMDILQ